MKLDGKTIYAQSSDIKSRTYLEYRKDMKKKAIAELEVLEWLRNKVKGLYPKKQVKVYKSGGDKFLWFLRKGGVSREPDFIAEIDNAKIEFEFQYAEKVNLDFYDFKVSKVAKKKGGKRVPVENKFFVYIHKPFLKYAIFKPEWVLNNGEYGMVEAWRSFAFRVPKEKFERLLKADPTLRGLCERTDAKNFILNFQHILIDINKDRLSYLLQGVIDENKIVKIIPKDMDSFFKVCFILDNLNKIPQNANLWLVYLLSYINKDSSLEDISKIVYCIDFLYSKIELKPNELTQLISRVKELIEKIKGLYQNDGSYKSSLVSSPLDETRYALFSINLLEDLIQDIIYYYSVTELEPITKIYENVRDVEKTYGLIKEAK
ncbi:MAG: hypothetical protein COX49_07650 [bacterium (Candidatus Stahlbacteria) CG23_combo_of_CG06-09_8_20_14_all_40_9]|nr:MAG: hypothetical protein COX49_07650 [bacterium (Candidatus Stahlbacteria) CG23_combo_of_CG06-09_8_20_14_all_40_9]